MELRQIEYFVRAASTGSVSAAAAELHMTQPALSRQIADLEREVGSQLFIRTAKGVTLTEAGEALYGHAHQLMGQVEKIPEIVRVAAAGNRVLRIGAPPGLPHAWFRSITFRVRAADPRIQLSLFEASSDEQRRLLRTGALDVGLLHALPREGHAVHILTQPLGAVVPPDSLLARRTSLALADLDTLMVMAHAVGEIKAQEVRLRAAADAAGIRAQWVFRRFSHHSMLIAELAAADAALTTQASAAINFPDWPWIPLDALDEAGMEMLVRTWVTWPATLQSRPVEVLVQAMIDEAGTQNGSGRPLTIPGQVKARKPAAGPLQD